jgi:hypothetical protein
LKEGQDDARNADQVQVLQQPVLDLGVAAVRKDLRREGVDRATRRPGHDLGSAARRGDLVFEDPSGDVEPVLVVVHAAASELGKQTNQM